MKKIIKLLLVMLVCFCVVGCDVDTPNDPTIDNPTVDDPIVEKPYMQLSFLNYEANKSVNSTEFINISEINKFALVTMKGLLNNSEEKVSDIFYSPASYYMALSMLAEGADGETYTELINLLNSTSLDDLKAKNDLIYKTNNIQYENSVVRMANSVWVRINKTVREEYIKNLIENYYSESFIATMGEEVLDVIAGWINENTYDFLNVKDDQLKNLIGNALVLINTIYFKSVWSEEFLESDTYNEVFNNGNELNVPFMHHTSPNQKYYDMNKFICATDSLSNGYKMNYCLPKDGYTVKDIFDTDFTNVINGAIRYKQETINYSVPKFKYQNKLDLVKMTKDLGVTSIFEPVNANFSKIVESNDIYVSSIDQIAGIDVNENGITAAVATIIGMKDNAINPEKAIDVKLDKPFLYYITDTNNVILFMGICYKPTC